MIEALYILVFRCERCFAPFLVISETEQRGGHKVAALLEANTCQCCGKGQVEYLGKVVVTR